MWSFSVLQKHPRKNSGFFKLTPGKNRAPKTCPLKNWVFLKLARRKIHVPEGSIFNFSRLSEVARLLFLDYVLIPDNISQVWESQLPISTLRILSLFLFPIMGRLTFPLLRKVVSIMRITLMPNTTPSQYWGRFYWVWDNLPSLTFPDYPNPPNCLSCIFPPNRLNYPNPPFYQNVKIPGYSGDFTTP